MMPLLAALLLDAQAAVSPRVAVEARPWGTAIAVVVAFPAGSAQDPEGAEGLARVTADAAARATASAAPPGAVFAADVTHDATFFSALLAPDAWPGAYRALVGTLLSPTLPEPEILAARAALLASLHAEAGAPVREVEAELRRAFLGAAHPAARPAPGDERSVQRLDARRVQEWFAGRFRASDAVVAVVGPVDTARGALLEPWKAAPAGPPPTTAVAPTPAPGPAPAERAARVTLYREVASTWIAVALPVAAETPAAARAFLAHWLEEQFTQLPRDPALFEASVREARLGSGDAIVATVVIAPEDAERWERRIQDTVERLRRAPLPGPAFETARRRFRAALALRLAYPEQAARRHAEALLRGGRAYDAIAAASELTPEAVAEAARALGPATVLVYGPDLGGGGARNEGAGRAASRLAVEGAGRGPARPARAGRVRDRLGAGGTYFRPKDGACGPITGDQSCESCGKG